jgi:hypothetical protein
MKVSRGVRKNGCNRAISIAFAAAMLAVCIVPALASATFSPPDPINLANTTGEFGANCTWQAGSEWYLIAGVANGSFYGFNQAGSTWQSDSTITSGLGNIGTNSAPTVFQKDGTWYLISGVANGSFYGFNQAGSAWQSDSTITSGLGDIGVNSAPTVFQKDGTWYLIAGVANGSFYGFNQAGSTWQSDSTITSGLGDIGVNSAPTVFNPSNATDSYNVSINGVWSNGTKNTFVNMTGSGRVNITVWAWNASGTGTLSAGCISDNVQVTRGEGPGDTFALVGSVPTGGREGTYPPGWFETSTPTPTVTVTVTATKAPAASAANASVDVAQAQPGESITPPPRATDPMQATAPAAGATPTKSKQGLPGFTAVFAAVGCLLAVYAMMRRRS